MYDCVIIGGGIAGLQCAIQLGRYRHKVLVLDANDGRSTLCQSYHNILGWPDGISGPELRHIGRLQASRLGVSFKTAAVTCIKRQEPGFTVEMTDNRSLSTRTVMVATGVKDNLAPIPGLLPTLGLSIYVCPDCDGYECSGKRTAVIGSGDVGASMAIELYYWTHDLLFINHSGVPVKADLRTKLKDLAINVIESSVAEIKSDNGETLRAITLASGESVRAERGFVAFGGNKVESDLLKTLGAQTLSASHVQVHPRTKMTNIPGLWAGGDVVAHSEQVTIAMGDGSQAAIWIHKALLGHPMPS